MPEKIKKTRKPKTKRLYFGPEVDLSIIKYNETTDELDRSRIYQVEIQPAFQKLAENIIHTFKFYYTDSQTLEQFQHEVVSFLVEKLSKFKQTNGKAFSYFSIIAKNYCILKNKNNYKKLTSHDRIDLSAEVDLEDLADETDQQVEISKFMDRFVDYWDEAVEVSFNKRTDKVLAYAIIDLFRKRERIELFNKKALYIYIREISDASTQQITKMVKFFKDKYRVMYSDFLQYGYLPKDKIY